MKHRTIGMILWGIFFSLGAVMSILYATMSGVVMTELKGRYLKAVEHRLNDIQEYKTKYENTIEKAPNSEEIKKKYFSIITDLRLTKDRIMSGEDIFNATLINVIAFFNGIFYLAVAIGLFFHFSWARVAAICSIFVSLISYIGILIITYIDVVPMILQADKTASLVVLMTHQQNQSFRGMELLNSHFFFVPSHLIPIIFTGAGLYYFNHPNVKRLFRTQNNEARA